LILEQWYDERAFVFVQTEEEETPTNIDVLKGTLMVSRREINCG